MAKAIGLDFLMLAVRNLNAAKHFYVDLLGLQVDSRFTNPTALSFVPGPIPFGIRTAAPGEAIPSGEDVTQAVTLWINCDDATRSMPPSRPRALASVSTAAKPVPRLVAVNGGR